MLHLKRYKGRRGLVTVEDCVLAETKDLSEYIRTQEEAMLKEVRRENILSAEETKEEYQKKMHDDRIKVFTENSLHGKFWKSTESIADGRSWKWIKM